MWEPKSKPIGVKIINTSVHFCSLEALPIPFASVSLFFFLFDFMRWNGENNTRFSFFSFFLFSYSSAFSSFSIRSHSMFKMVQNSLMLRHLIIHFPMSSGMSECSRAREQNTPAKQAARRKLMSERANGTFKVSIRGSSEPQCSDPHYKQEHIEKHIKSSASSLMWSKRSEFKR